jgi:hypothetical protein
MTSNAQRAHRAHVALQAYAAALGDDVDSSGELLRDLLSDIGHWCEANELSFGDAFVIAMMHYAWESLICET